MTKILFLINNLGQGGAEKVLVNLVSGLNPEKYDITVMTVCNEGVNCQFLPEGIKYRYVFPFHVPKCFEFFKLFSPKFLHRLFIKEKYDIEVAYLQGPCGRIVAGCQNRDTKLIAWIHGTKKDKKTGSQGFRSFGEAKKIYQKFTKIVCVSQSVKEAFDSVFYTEDKSVVLYNVNQTEKIKKLSEEQTDISFSENEFSIITAGSLIPVKGFDRLIRVQKKLLSQGYSTHIYILGKGSDGNKLEALAQKEGVAQNVTFLGYKENPYAYIAKADLYVCSSYTEALSTSVTEAMILGLPAVTCDCSGMKEILGDNEAGLIAENDENALYEGIKYVLDNREILDYYRENAKKRAVDFEENTILKVHEELFDRIINI